MNRFNIRDYQINDRVACLEIFKSNNPLYFEPHEQILFEKFLDFRNGETESNPVYNNIIFDTYYIIETGEGIMGCGGFYVLKDEPTAEMAWGMIHLKDHKKGYGSLLYKYRVQKIFEYNPTLRISLNTSQHTFGFYEKMGLKVTDITKNGYGLNLDKYDMFLI
nr:GNAT family N-acetyltransferase [Pseudopedobacter sp.]